ncbi:MAG: 3'-5' exoribonuclease YhaM family protein [Rubinisphaera brasiliensis]|uniref:Metal dependent phosphohydrolase n=1 Tax=Rubinisphaera brasiliensis (strain ATCC 49424 / DSM 5305 / JCM 21570 / IAM 15109 / NBRC 103401 / IFAM 1448) TaxID=756272 RepID=F0SSN5_RUBBR|nr:MULTISPECIES: HD domain-containing protein [Rubinisphaera]ADY60351.1 metal dependent phosphohydrolase [Rubinisphaera brasiliensis DSM 5305]
MSRRFINEINDGELIEEIFVLADKQLRANRNGDTYLLADLRDKTGSLHGLLWNISEDSVAHINAGDYVKVKGKVQLYNGNLQIILTRIDAVNETQIDLNDFQAGSSQDVEKMFSRLTELLRSISDPQLRRLMEAFLDDETLMMHLKNVPAGVKAHHAYLGGLLEHVVNLMEAGDRICGLYPSVSRDLLLVGIFLHDLGKVRELTYDGTFAYTDEGQLIGHLIIGVELLNEKLNQLLSTGESVDEEKILRIKHLIASHHGTYEFGSPKLPMTPEAILLHHLDNIDAKVNEFTSMIESDPNRQSHWTPFNPRMDRKLFKGLVSQE